MSSITQTSIDSTGGGFVDSMMLQVRISILGVGLSVWKAVVICIVIERAEKDEKIEPTSSVLAKSV
jgi:hypothetical protein